MDTVSRKPYSTDLTNEQWAILEPLIPPAKHGGHPREVGCARCSTRCSISTGQVANGACCPTICCPRAPFTSISSNGGKTARGSGSWMVPSSRVADQREPTPTWLDRQSNRKNDGTGWRARVRWREEDQRAKTPCFRGYFGALAGGGRDQCSMGRWGRRAQVFSQLDNAKCPRLTKIWADNKYRNHELDRWLEKHRDHWDLDIKSRPEGAVGFVPVPKRWVVERTFAWLEGTAATAGTTNV